MDVPGKGRHKWFSNLLASSEVLKLTYLSTMKGPNPPPATRMPNLDHIKLDEIEMVYEPCEDSWLLCDGIEVDIEDLMSRHPSFGVELGIGSGIVSTFLLMLYNSKINGAQTQGIRHDNSGTKGLCDAKSIEAMSPLRILGIDINPMACRISKQTAEANEVGVFYDSIRCDLFQALEQRMQGNVDVMLFNPPYVPTPSDEIPDKSTSFWAGTSQTDRSTTSFGRNANSSDIDEFRAARDLLPAAWAGGDRGREIIDKVITVVPRILRKPKNESSASSDASNSSSNRGGVAYWILVEENEPKELREIFRQLGLDAKIIATRRAHNELLHVFKIAWKGDL